MRRGQLRHWDCVRVRVRAVSGTGDSGDSGDAVMIGGWLRM